MFADGVEALGLFIAYAKESLTRDAGNDELASTLATTLQKLASVQSEQRKALAEERRRLQKVTKADVLAFFRTMEPAEGIGLLREAGRIFEESSVLA
jgi:hypothetical protein